MSAAEAFVIRVWVERTPDEAAPARWRGHITHTITRHQRYVQSFDEIVAFIEPYLRRMGADVAPDAGGAEPGAAA